MYPRLGYCASGLTELTEVPGTGMKILQNFQKFRALYGYGSVTELPEVPGIVAQAYRTHRSSGRIQSMMYPHPGYCGSGLTELTEVPGTGMKILQNFQNFRVLWLGVQNFLKFRAGVNMLYPYPGSLWHRRTELLEVPGRGMSVLQNFTQVLYRVKPW